MRVKKRLENLAVLGKIMPVLNSLIESAGNFEVALDLILKASNLIEKELKTVSVCA